MRVLAMLDNGQVTFNINGWHVVGANLEGNIVEPKGTSIFMEERFDVLTGNGLTLQSWEYGVDASSHFPLRRYNLEGEMVSDRDWPDFHPTEYNGDIYVPNQYGDMVRGNPWFYTEDDDNK
jgi:hypothetical protein